MITPHIMIPLLFPAYAGVIPRLYALADLEVSFPRLRGGDPRKREHQPAIAAFSPPTRG